MKIKAYFLTTVFGLFSIFSIVTGVYNLKNFSDTKSNNSGVQKQEKNRFIPYANYGIDIKGGQNVSFAVKFNKYFQDYFNELGLRLKNEFSNDVEFVESDADGLILNLKENSKLSVYKIKEKIDPQLSVDLKEKKYIIYTSARSKQVMQAFILEDFIRISRNRIDGLGVKEVVIQTVDNDHFSVKIPVGIDANSIINILSKTAQLSFHLVTDPKPIVFDTKNTDRGSIIVPVYYESQQSEDELKIFYKINKEVLLTGKNIKNAYASRNETGSVVNFQLDSQGGYEFAKITQANKGRALAIVVDGKLLTAPYIHDTIPSGSGSISGNFSFEKANELAIMLKSGALPLEIDVASENIISPSSGALAIKKAKFALLFAVTLIMLLLIYLYGMLGVIANITMVLNFFATFTIFAITGFTLTLPGIAAMVLTLGMIVDANILIYERINETKTKDLKIRVQNAYSKAMIAITDSNITTIIAALTLVSFGLGFIRSFGISLIIGSVTSVFYSCVITKYMIQYFIDLKIIKKFKLL